jgi:hypothetical protein
MKLKILKKIHKKNWFRHLTVIASYDASNDGKLRHLPHLGVSTVCLKIK